MNTTATSQDAVRAVLEAIASESYEHHADREVVAVLFRRHDYLKAFYPILSHAPSTTTSQEIMKHYARLSIACTRFTPERPLEFSFDYDVSLEHAAGWGRVAARTGVGPKQQVRVEAVGAVQGGAPPLVLWRSCPHAKTIRPIAPVHAKTLAAVARAWADVGTRGVRGSHASLTDLHLMLSNQLADTSPEPPTSPYIAASLRLPGYAARGWINALAFNCSMQASHTESVSPWVTISEMFSRCRDEPHFAHPFKHDDWSGGRGIADVFADYAVRVSCCGRKRFFVCARLNIIKSAFEFAPSIAQQLAEQFGERAFDTPYDAVRIADNALACDLDNRVGIMPVWIGYSDGDALACYLHGVAVNTSPSMLEVLASGSTDSATGVHTHILRPTTSSTLRGTADMGRAYLLDQRDAGSGDNVPQNIQNTIDDIVVQMAGEGTALRPPFTLEWRRVTTTQSTGTARSGTVLRETDHQIVVRSSSAHGEVEVLISPVNHPRLWKWFNQFAKKGYLTDPEIVSLNSSVSPVRPHQGSNQHDRKSEASYIIDQEVKKRLKNLRPICIDGRGARLLFKRDMAIPIKSGSLTVARGYRLLLHLDPNPADRALPPIRPSGPDQRDVARQRELDEMKRANDNEDRFA